MKKTQRKWWCFIIYLPVQSRGDAAVTPASSTREPGPSSNSHIDVASWKLEPPDWVRVRQWKLHVCLLTLRLWIIVPLYFLSFAWQYLLHTATSAYDMIMATSNKRVTTMIRINLYIVICMPILQLEKLTADPLSSLSVLPNLHLYGFWIVKHLNFVWKYKGQLLVMQPISSLLKFFRTWWTTVAKKQSVQQNSKKSFVTTAH